jgi:chemotaxis protein MotB
MRRLTFPTLLATLAFSPLVACISKDNYDAAVADAQQAHAQLQATEKARQAEEADLTQQLTDARQKLQDLDQKLRDLSTTDHDLRARLDESTAIGAQLRGELEKLGRNVDSMLQERGTWSKALDDAKGRLDELRKAQAAADARAKLFKDFIQKLKSMIDAGQLRVATRAGRLVIQLPNDVLFDSGQKAVKPAGKQALTALAKVLVTVPARSFQVAGDTDDLPIQTQRFPSNWELSTARAVEVVHFLISQAVDPHALSAAGYGEFDPVSSNDTPDGRAKNRRIEITLQPNLDELVAAPGIK